MLRRTAAGSRATSGPATSARPPVGTIMVERMRKSVDFPPPFGPSKPKISPALTSKLTFESARRDPYRCGDNWLFKVSDNGVGIEPAYHQQVFGVFKRLHGSKIPGIGIGLAI